MDRQARRLPCRRRMRRRLASCLVLFLLVTTGCPFWTTNGGVAAQQPSERRNVTPNIRLLQATTVQELQDALRDGANVNARNDRTGQTALMAATLQGQTELVEFLLQNTRVDPSVGEKDGYTPPHGAGFQGRADVMRVLKEHGLDVVRDFHADGYAPLHRACWGGEARHTDTVRYLLEEAGAPADLPGGPDRRTCLEMTSNPRTKALLLEWTSNKEEL